MGYLGSQASFTGTQNNKRVSVVATAGQANFVPSGGYNINAIDVYRNGVKLVSQRDFIALDGVTITLTQAANADDILEFVIFENFAVDDVLSSDGDQVVNGNFQVSGDLTVSGTINASVSNTLSAGIATEAIRAGMSTESTRAGIATQVDGYLGVGVTGTNLNVTGVITANSFSGDGSGLTGIAATDDVSTNGLVVLGISTLAGATFSGVSTFNDNVVLNANLDLQDNDRIRIGTGDDLQLYHDGSNSVIGDFGTGSLFLAGADMFIQNASSENYITCNSNAAVRLYYDNAEKLATTTSGVTVTGTVNATSFSGDGSSVSNVNATTLDSVDSTSFLRSDTSDDATSGVYKFYNDAGIDITNTGQINGLQIFQSTANADAIMSFHVSGDFALHFGLDGDTNDLAVGGWSMGATKYKVWHDGNISATSNAYGTRTVQSGGSPSGGSDGDIYYIY